MKAKIKSTGEVVETIYQDCHCCYCEFPDGISRFISIDELEYLIPPQLIDWEQRRYEISKEVLAGLANDQTNLGMSTGSIVSLALIISDELIKQLKGE